MLKVTLGDWSLSREDFTFDKERNVYTCPAGKTLTTTGTLVNDGETLLYLASTPDCRSCSFKAQCCPKAPFRRIPRSIYEEARDVARDEIRKLRPMVLIPSEVQRQIGGRCCRTRLLLPKIFLRPSEHDRQAALSRRQGRSL